MRALLALALVLLCGRVLAEGSAARQRFELPAAVSAVDAVPGDVAKTAVLGWVAGDEVMAGTWSFAARRFVARRQVRRCVGCAVRLARSRDRIVVLVGGAQGTDAKLELIVLASDLSERSSVLLGKGTSPIVDADARYILAGAWEERPPVVPARDLGDLLLRPRHVLSLRILDAASLGIVGARTFTGDHLLLPNFVLPQTMQAARLAGDLAFVALPEDDVHILRVRLPSLATEAERTFSARVFESTAAIDVLGATSVVVSTRNDAHVFSLSLVPKSVVPSSDRRPIRVDSVEGGEWAISAEDRSVSLDRRSAN